MQDEKKISIKPKLHNLVLENRQKLVIAGVIDVESFNAESVVVDTELGILSVRGEGLHISRLNLENSELNIEGDIYSIDYEEREGSRSKGGFLSRMFR